MRIGAVKYEIPMQYLLHLLYKYLYEFNTFCSIFRLIQNLQCIQCNKLQKDHHHTNDVFVKNVTNAVFVGDKLLWPQYFTVCIWSFSTVPTVALSVGQCPGQAMTNTLHPTLSHRNLFRDSSKNWFPSVYPSNSSSASLDLGNTVLSSSCVDTISPRESWDVISWNKSPFMMLQSTYRRRRSMLRSRWLERASVGPSAQEETRMWAMVVFPVPGVPSRKRVSPTSGSKAWRVTGWPSLKKNTQDCDF